MDAAAAPDSYAECYPGYVFFFFLVGMLLTFFIIFFFVDCAIISTPKVIPTTRSIIQKWTWYVEDVSLLFLLSLFFLKFFLDFRVTEKVPFAVGISIPNKNTKSI